MVSYLPSCILRIFKLISLNEGRDFLICFVHNVSQEYETVPLHTGHLELFSEDRIIEVKYERFFPFDAANSLLRLSFMKNYRYKLSLKTSVLDINTAIRNLFLIFRCVHYCSLDFRQTIYFSINFSNSKLCLQCYRFY